MRILVLNKYDHNTMGCGRETIINAGSILEMYRTETQPPYTKVYLAGRESPVDVWQTPEAILDRLNKLAATSGNAN